MTAPSWMKCEQDSLWQAGGQAARSRYQAILTNVTLCEGQPWMNSGNLVVPMLCVLSIILGHWWQKVAWSCFRQWELYMHSIYNNNYNPLKAYKMLTVWEMNSFCTHWNWFIQHWYKNINQNVADAQKEIISHAVVLYNHWWLYLSRTKAKKTVIFLFKFLNMYRWRKCAQLYFGEFLCGFEDE